jgi:hypothetical protein
MSPNVANQLFPRMVVVVVGGWPGSHKQCLVPSTYESCLEKEDILCIQCSAR